LFAVLQYLDALIMVPVVQNPLMKQTTIHQI
jgi:hypothetical protein